MSTDQSNSNYIGPIFGVEHPLMDISAFVDINFLNKYNLTINSAILADSSNISLFNELKSNYILECTPGGSVQNTLRVAQWILNIKGATHFAGTVGNDVYGQTLKQLTEKEGVTVHYNQHDILATGTCAVLVNEKDRCLVADLSACLKHDISHLHEPKVAKAWRDAKFYYTSGFFLAQNLPSTMLLAKHAFEVGKLFFVNLAAPYVCLYFKDSLIETIKYSDYVFGNESECLAFGQSMNYDIKSDSLENLEYIAKQIANIENIKSNSRFVVITRGSAPTMVTYNNQIAYFPVPVVPREKIVDLNGAGDAFVGGFLSQIVLGKSIFDCIRAGHYGAGVVIQTSGIKLEGESKFQ